jgi:hypothetical protein
MKGIVVDRVCHALTALQIQFPAFILPWQVFLSLFHPNRFKYSPPRTKAAPIIWIPKRLSLRNTTAKKMATPGTEV